MVNKTLFIRYFVPSFTGFGMAALAFGFGIKGVLVALLLSSMLILFSMASAGGLGGSVANRLYGTCQRTRTIVDQVAGDLDRIRHLKRAEEFSKALVMVNNILVTVPGYPEALYLKAEILREGYGNRKETIKCLREVMRLTNFTDKVHRWAVNMLDEVTEK
ncbi:MAG: hypothetical protein KKG35_03005 [Proteobacteria bacterium]|nr:hypothetical protein [Pseudomonadota bacterium]